MLKDIVIAFFGALLLGLAIWFFVIWPDNDKEQAQYEYQLDVQERAQK